MATDKCLCNLAPGTPHDAVEGLSRYTHLLSSLRPVQAFGVGQLQCLKFIGCQLHLLQVGKGDAPGFEITGCR